MPEVLLPEEAAALLRLNPSQLYELTRSRSQARSKHPLPFCRVGKHLRFRRSSLLEWLSAIESREAQ